MSYVQKQESPKTFLVFVTYFICCKMIGVLLGVKKSTYLRLYNYISRMVWPICLKFHNNSVHCLYWTTVKSEPNQFISFRDIWSQISDFLHPKEVHQSFWNGGSICYILETFRTEVVLGRLYYLAIKPSSEAIVDSCSE